MKDQSIFKAEVILSKCLNRLCSFKEFILLIAHMKKNCIRPVVTDDTTNEILWKWLLVEKVTIHIVQGGNKHQRFILCPLTRIFCINLFADVICNVAISDDDLINDDTVIVVGAICWIVRAPNERLLRLWTLPLFLELNSCLGVWEWPAFDKHGLCRPWKK